MASRTLTIPGLLCLTVCIACVGGCEDEKFTSTVFNPLNLKLPFLPYQEPVRIGIVDHRTGLFDPSSWNIEEVGSPWNPLRRALEQHLGRPVQMEALKPFQIAAHIQSGRLQFAMLGAADYLGASKEFGSFGEVIGISKVKTRQGLIVARAKSDVQSFADIKGKRFAFGPIGDAVLDVAAKEALVANGVPLDDIQREVLPVPTAFQHHISSNEAAYEVVWGLGTELGLGTEVGVIEREEYDAMPESGGSLLLRTFGKDNFRVLGETKVVRIDTIPEGPLLASTETDPKLVEEVREFLVTAGKKHSRELTAMGLAGFDPPPADVQAELERIAVTEGPAEPLAVTPD